MALDPWSDGEEPNPYFWAVFHDQCGHFERERDRLHCFDKLVADWSAYEPWRYRPPLDGATIDWITGDSDHDPSALPLEHPSEEVAVSGEEAIATPMWARIFADISFFFTVAILVWGLFQTGLDYSFPTTVDGIVGDLVVIGFGLVILFLINLPSIIVVHLSTPTGTRQYDALERWLGWLWKWRQRPVDTEWVTIGQYSGTDYADYLQSEQWRRRRELMLRKADHRCQLCNSKDRLQVHHRTYDRIFKERPEDLVVLCRSCHETFHGINRH